MSAPHTPGPWYYEDTDVRSRWPFVIKGMGLSRLTLAEVHDVGPATEANARLFAASRALLAACEQAVKNPDVGYESRALLNAAIESAVAPRGLLP